MKKTTMKQLGAAFFVLCLFHGLCDTASAHRVNVFAWVEGDTVHVEGKFPGGKKVKGGKVRVMDLQGNERLSGLTDETGEFTFNIPQRTDLRIVLVAGQGHQAEWTIRASEMADLPLKTVPGTGIVKPESFVQTATPPESNRAVAAAVSSEELETIVETVLDRKLKPIHRMLVESRQDGPTVTDIFGGIGYILGLVGIAAYVQSRKKKG